MKIAVVAYLHGNGGAERQIIMLANNLKKIGHNVYLLILAENKIRYDIASGIKIIDLTTKEENYNGGLVRILKRFLILKTAYKQIVPDISIHYNLQSAYLTCIMSKHYTGKIIYSERGDPSDKKEYPLLLKAVRKICESRISGFVFQTQGARDYFGEQVRAKSIIIPNPVAVHIGEFPICTKRDKRIINIGRLFPQKNQKLLIDAFALITNLIPEYSLDIYGEGVLKETLLNQIKMLGLENRIHVEPPVKDIFPRLQKASLFILSSDYEGMPNALMEALALGVPSISTDCSPGGARELIIDGYNGYIVPRNDAKELANKMLYVLSHRDVMEQCARNAIKIVETHNETRIFQKWNNYIESVVNGSYGEKM